MKKQILLCILALFIVITLNSVSAIQPTQQYSKIYVNPFYRATLSANTNYTSNLTINPPDGLDSVLSAIVTYQVYLSSVTATFTLWVNDKSCNSSTFVVSSTYGQAGEGMLYFDCSNIIKNKGTYFITLRSSTAIGANTGWLDLTYMNNPMGDISLHGTEYRVGDSGKLFLQFLDSNKKPITNSACIVDMWYPNSTKWVNESAMTYLDEGIYYYNFLVPNVLGIYPATAECFIPYQFSNIIVPNTVVDTFESNTFTGGTGWATFGNFTGWDYYNAFISNTGCYQGTYCAYVSGASGSTEYLERGFVSPPNTMQLDICYAVKQTGFGTGDKMEIDIFDGTWHTLDYYDNTLTAGTWYPHCHNVTTSTGYKLDNNAILFGVYAFNLVSPSKNFYIDNITIGVRYANTTISNVSQYQILYGSGELHVSPANSTVDLSSISQNVWSFPNRTASNNDSTIMLYSGTEYQTGEAGKIVLQVLKDIAGGGNQPVTGLSCNDTILYPNQTIFDSKIMTELPSPSIGIYTHNFTAPSSEGIYIAYTVCTQPGKTYYGTHTFHVAPWANTIVSMSSLLNSSYNLLLYINATTKSINGTVTNIQTTVTSMNNLLIFMNQTNTNTYNLLTTVNNEIVFINGSLNTLNNNVLNINGTLTYLKDVILFINGTTTSNSQSLLNINAVLARVNDTVLFINGTDTTILGIVNTTNNNVLFVNGTTTNINNYLQGYITSSLTNLTTTTNNIYSTVTFINSTSIEINGTTHNIASYLQTTVLSLLNEINYTTHNLNVTATVDFSSVYTRLDTLQQIVTTSKDFTQEQVFLITDSVGQLKQTASGTPATEADIKATLENVEKNLIRFQEISTPKTKESPIQLTSIDSGLVILIFGIIIIVILSQYKGLERQDKKPPEEVVYRLPSLRDRR